MGQDENDWKHLRRVHESALQRFCGRILAEASEVAMDSAESPHQRYLALFKLIQDRDEDVAVAFNDMRRSRAAERLAAMMMLECVTDDELAGFSVSFLESARVLADLSQKYGRRP